MGCGVFKVYSYLLGPYLRFRQKKQKPFYFKA
ncbi:hypothetical protein CHY_0744 [Carboxydothermus hydrogenoformans Z-2901]|uniref:Uncharacterized protein n=1 Tax=Carboxydothermus hydrogenoformans (strain ATCC BAA-161 / DSM 6008 / Z-2901) TaxID=246194 RepID=Q3AE36_CARHZ|nr:hypothetical protein CHY_0744 [Carboxydothermus hydrogenoformans Z-2901]